MHTSDSSQVLNVSLSYDRDCPRSSAVRLAYAVRPEWEQAGCHIDVYQFVGGLMNSLFKISYIAPDQSREEADRQALLLRVYGLKTEVVVDRDLEAAVHAQLAGLGLAAPLVARFENGLIYGFVPGVVCGPQDMIEPKTWRLVARTLGEWHARLHLPGGLSNTPRSPVSQGIDEAKLSESQKKILGHGPLPNIWTEMQSWILLLPEDTELRKSRKAQLQVELERSFRDLEEAQALADRRYVVGHNDLLSANVILPAHGAHPKHDSETQVNGSWDGEVLFIDYEYAKYAPAAFDLANHFSEWGGFECDYNMIPSREVRRKFVEEYLDSFTQWQPLEDTKKTAFLESLLEDVDRYRGLPGFRWALHALIEETITEIDFDWTAYADLRLAEYWAWRGEDGGQRASSGSSQTLRELRWAQ